MIRGYDVQRSKDWRIITSLIDVLTGRIKDNKGVSSSELEQEINKFNGCRIMVNHTHFIGSDALPINNYAVEELAHNKLKILNYMFELCEKECHEPLITKSEEYRFKVIKRGGFGGNWLNITPYRNSKKIPMRMDVFDVDYKNPAGITPVLEFGKN